MRSALSRLELVGQCAGVEIRTAAGPSSAEQWVFVGGPYTTASQVRQCQVVCPATAVTKAVLGCRR
jgi:hypothetical protein